MNRKDSNFYMKIPPAFPLPKGVKGDFHASLSPLRAWVLFNKPWFAPGW
jgi:hypothetical protein